MAMSKPFKLPLSASFAWLCGFIGALHDGVLLLGSNKHDVNAAVPFTIPTTGWKMDTSISSHPNYLDITVGGLRRSDIVDVNVSPVSAVVASAAEFTNTESFDGKFRLRCKYVPDAEISAEYHVTNTVEYTTE